MPGIAAGGLLLAPFIDRGPERRPIKRPFATGFMLLALASVVFLTWESVVNHDWEAAKKQGAIVKTVAVDKEAEGYKLMQKNTCLTCHGDNLQGGAAAPTLQNLSLTEEEIAKIAKNGKGAMPYRCFKCLGFHVIGIPSERCIAPSVVL